jgi:hypothetical protein
MSPWRNPARDIIGTGWRSATRSGATLVWPPGFILEVLKAEGCEVGGEIRYSWGAAAQPNHLGYGGRHAISEEAGMIEMGQSIREFVPKRRWNGSGPKNRSVCRSSAGAAVTRASTAVDPDS